MSTVKFDYFAPASLEEALELLAEKGEQARLLAGGTDLMIRIRHGLLRPAAVIGLKRIPGLERISFQANQGLTIGAAARLAEVAAHPAVRRRYPAVALAARETANVQIRNMGTVVGNLCNAAPSADNAPSLLALGAELLLARKGRERSLPLESFFKGPGLTALEPGEMVTAVRVPPPPPHSGTSYQHISARGKVDISAVSVGRSAGLAGEPVPDGEHLSGGGGADSAQGRPGGEPTAREGPDPGPGRKSRRGGRRGGPPDLRHAGQRRIPSPHGGGADQKGSDGGLWARQAAPLARRGSR